VLIRQLPRDSALATSLNDGQPVWSSTEHLLADLWAVLVKVNSDPAKTPDNLDHPIRQEAAAKATAESKKRLKELFLARKREVTK
jgi:hypothetical protein